MSTDPLFDLVVPPTELPPLKEQRFGAVDTKWTKWSGAHRPCDDCVTRIHERGVEGAPPPGEARWRRKGPNGELFLCNVDAEERKRLDAAAVEERDTRLRLAEEARQRARRR